MKKSFRQLKAESDKILVKLDFIFSFTDQTGNELCLRPDLTIASCLRYMENNLKGKEKIFYSGQAYRKSENKKDSIIRNQIGFEC